MAVNESDKLLQKIDFGFGSADLEGVEMLRRFFYRSGDFHEACSSKTYLILGPKGSGKSAIFKMLRDESEDTKPLQSPNLLITDEPQLRACYQAMKNNPKFGDSQVTLWRFYLASLISGSMSGIAEDLPNDLIKLYGKFLVACGMKETSFGRRWIDGLKVKAGLPGLGDLELTLPKDAPPLLNQIDQLFAETDSWLKERNGGKGCTLWICLDRLDEVSLNGGNEGYAEIEELTSNLLKAVSEVLRYTNIRLKLFIRSDIWSRVTFVNKDFFIPTKHEIEWSSEDLFIMIAHRLIAIHPEFNESETIDFHLAFNWIDAFFEWHGSAFKDFDDLCEKFKDGRGMVMPRVLIDFCIECQKAQSDFNRKGIAPARPPALISSRAINSALKKTAQSRIEDFMKVFEKFAHGYQSLRGGASRNLTREQLAFSLGFANPADAQSAISSLERIGAIQIADKKAIHLADQFRIPYLFAVALEIGDLQ